ncbi:CAP domain-containing protein Ecym_6326 [Eremothecium cymbalariae DBVPG|uniref:SCP domain-containing protein n=1 Tax=Eremothecium cymbalariae (strain CBS 270.75 / DBVPG 7215 / KCTC 17166 / NRRL Y-17582) TaxID=931890 RepID=G8JUC2_ERECY|nr:hypothetical protein Ecym_6326 [Eremothecium cymbalariae DBVPG\
MLKLYIQILLLLYFKTSSTFAKTKYNIVTKIHTKTVTSFTSVTFTGWTTIQTTSYRTQTTPLTETPKLKPNTLDQNFASQVLNLHNDYRRQHEASMLTWNDTLYKKAQEYANNAVVCNGTLIHSKYPYGENLALGYNSSAAIAAWYDENKIYNYNQPGFSRSTGHFTQMVWKNTTSIGCAYIICGEYYGQYTICEYDPPGNVEGQYADNVLSSNLKNT